MPSYATPADMLLRYDWREIGDLLSDSNEQVSALDQVTAGNQYNTTLLQLLSDASGDIEASLLVAGRYTTTDLSGLGGNALALLKRITCEITIAYLYERRPLYRPEQLEQYAKSKEGHLKRLADGKNVFNLPLIADSGQETVSGMSTVDYDNLHLVTDRTQGYYPRRQLPFNR